MTTLTMRDVMVKRAETDMAGYPQYKGHWDKWVIGTVTKRLKTKLGVAFEAGDEVLVNPEVRSEKVAPRGKSLPYAEWPLKLFRVCYSFRNRCDTQILAEDVYVKSN